MYHDFLKHFLKPYVSGSFFFFTLFAAVCILMQNPACGLTFDTSYEIVTPESECGELFADEMFLTFNDTDRVLSAVPYLRACSYV